MLSVLSRHIRLQLQSTFMDSQFRFITGSAKGSLRNRSVSDVPQDHPLPNSAFHEPRALGLQSPCFKHNYNGLMIKMDQQFIPVLCVVL